MIVAQASLSLSDPIVCQAPLSTGFSRQEYWNGLPYPPPGDHPKPGIEPKSLYFGWILTVISIISHIYRFLFYLMILCSISLSAWFFHLAKYPPVSLILSQMTGALFHTRLSNMCICIIFSLAFSLWMGT